MARVAVVTSHPLFAKGGHLVIADGLTKALREAGHEATVIRTPQNRFGRQGAAYLATWLTDVGLTFDGHPIDHLVSFRFPSYAVRHPSHVCWLNHRMREYYDQWPRFSGPLSWRGRGKERLRRRVIHAADRYLLTRNVRRVFAQSRTIQRRLERWGDIPSEVLYPPPPPRPYRCDEYGDYLFVASRLSPLKRVGLVLEALAHPVADGIQCVIAGDGEEREALRSRIDDLGLGDRVRLAGSIDETELVEHLACCRAVCYVPSAEDYGLVTLEAFVSRKAVITCVDSGGPAELVRSDEEGLVALPDPESLANAFRRVFDDVTLAERLGVAAEARAREFTWEQTIQRLLVG
ncbi:MAG: glycosyltransferase family 4 protein [Vicinamibacterales bacterium]|nr:glycosyltransferase family 4 protein [Vicinamibacterales bacterium]